MQIPDILFNAIAPAVPERILAGSGSTPMWLWLFSGWRPDRKRFVFQTHFMGGLGARHAKDGLSTAAFPYNMTDSPVEIIENSCPVVIHKRELLCDSGGAGRFRGGLGQEVAISPAPARLGYIEGAMTASFSAGHLKAGPAGLGGGESGMSAKVAVNGQPVDNPLMTLRLEEKDVLTIRLPGGGGYHRPHERDPQAVRTDVLEGFISPEAAASIYGVALNGPTCMVDLAGTQKLRGEKRKKVVEASDARVE
jgi:N-methylhydantoinase B